MLARFIITFILWIALNLGNGIKLHILIIQPGCEFYIDLIYIKAFCLFHDKIENNHLDDLPVFETIIHHVQQWILYKVGCRIIKERTLHQSGKSYGPKVCTCTHYEITLQRGSAFTHNFLWMAFSKNVKFID